MKQLIGIATRAREKAYAPYSNFHVGAALLLSDGSIVSGANVENASYGLCMCAERVAVGTAVASGKSQFQAIAVVTETSPPAAPCGMCRQVLAEFAPNLKLILANTRGEIVETTLETIFSMQFSKSDLK